MLSLIVWSLFGGIAGAFFGVLMQRDSRHELARNVAVGVVGALFGGFLFDWDLAPSLLLPGSVLTATAEAVALLAAVHLFRKPIAHAAR
jgi:uncharacterized membrane protein YeaQ/YmgE (transglycosylase-associated protein family)